MICKATETIEKYSMLRRGAHVIAALSGGADSVAMTHLLYTLREKYGFTLTAAHVNHGIRGENADRDEKFVRDFCEKLGIKLDVLRADVPRLAQESGEGIEECGRRVRYEFFKEINPNAVVATAHNLNDNAETLLFRICRGSGIKGLGSIPPTRGNIIRPLIACSRAEIEKYCAENSLEYVTDETNLSTDYTRNYIRHEILPLFMNMNPAFLDSAFRLSEIARSDETALSDMAAALKKDSALAAGYSAEKLLSAAEAIRRRLLSQIILEETGERAEAKHIESLELLLRKGGKIQVIGGADFRVRKGILERVPNSSDSSPWRTEISPGTLDFPGGSLDFAEIYKNDLTYTQKVNKHMLDIFLDCDKIVGKLVLRSKADGDSFSPQGFDGTKKLKKLFQEKGIPPEKRSAYPVLCDDVGVVAVPGFGVGGRTAVGAETEKIFELRFKLF